jgi:type I restriction enzyme S subunit
MVLTPRANLDIVFFRYLLLHIGLFNLSDNSGIPQLNNKHLYPTPFPVPPIEEQRRIGMAISCVDDRGFIEARAKRGLEGLKQALMSVLLTGELRVTPEPAP